MLPTLSKDFLSQIVCESSGDYKHFTLKILISHNYPVWHIQAKHISAFIILKLRSILKCLLYLLLKTTEMKYISVIPIEDEDVYVI